VIKTMLARWKLGLQLGKQQQLFAWEEQLRVLRIRNFVPKSFQIDDNDDDDDDDERGVAKVEEAKKKVVVGDGNIVAPSSYHGFCLSCLERFTSETETVCNLCGLKRREISKKMERELEQYGEDFYPYKLRKGRGIHNAGNTCFANAALQVLLHTPFFHNYFRIYQSEIQAVIQKSKLKGKKYFRELVAFMGQEFSSITQQTLTIKTCIRPLLSRMGLGGGRQHDADEFRIKFINMWQELILDGKNKLAITGRASGELVDIFTMVMGLQEVSQTLCVRKNKDVSVIRTELQEPGPSLHINLHPQNSSVQDTLEDYFQNESMLKENFLRRTPPCKKQEKKLTYSLIGKYLPCVIIQEISDTKRVRLDGEYSILPNITIKSEWQAKDLSMGKTRDVVYRPRGFVMHESFASEGSSCGHYVAYVRVKIQNRDKSFKYVWHQKDDFSSRIVDLETLRTLESIPRFIMYERV